MHALAPASLLPLLLALPTAAQQPAYTVEVLDALPGASSTIGTGLDNHGNVVGWSAMSSGPASLVGWIWRPGSGFEVLPQPFGSTRSRAIDVNDAGVIAGDGGFDSGVAWRWENGEYELLDTLNGDPRAYASGINAAGHVLGTSQGVSFTDPRSVFLDVAGVSLSILVDGTSGYLNDLDQITGTATPGFTTIEAFRYTPGVGIELLGPLRGKTFTRGTSINGLGHVVGYATQANGNASVPFLYTDAAGMVEIGDFGGSASASSINDRGEVVGSFSPSGGARAWVWSEEQGVRFLNDLIEAPLLNVQSALRINERGQILARAFDNTVADFRTVVLTPVQAGVRERQRRLGAPLPR